MLYPNYQLFFSVLLTAVLWRWWPVVAGAPIATSRIQNLRARYDHPTDAIYVQWSYPVELQTEEQPQFIVRYRITNRPDDAANFQWKYARTGSEMEARLDLNEVRNGDELQAQVRVERSDGTILEDWSQSLLIAISKRVLIDGVPVDDDDLLPPLDFQAHILSPSMIRLEWSPAIGALSNEPKSKGYDFSVKNYYIVNVKQLTSDDNSPLLRQQIKIEANSFTLGSLKPGERYELTIRTASSPERVSSTAAIVEITMPREDEYFEVGNLIISSHFKGTGQGTVNLTWEVPEKVQSKIKAYDVQYTEAGLNNWQQLRFSGERPSASLTTLKSDTEYLLKIRTILYNNLTTESGQFKFRTPAVVPNPINKVDVIYTHEITAVRLQWTLENFLPAQVVAGYDVYLSDNPDLPDAEWTYYRLNVAEAPDGDATASGANSLALHDLEPGRTYYVRINVRKKDGELLRAPSIYRFKTMERTEILERREANTLSYRLLSPGRVQISWTYPTSVARTVTGCSVLYTDNNAIPTEQWERIDLIDPQQNSVILEQLKPNSRYFIRIIPQINYSFYDSSVIDMFEIRTGSPSHLQFPSVFSPPSPSDSTHSHPRQMMQQQQQSPAMNSRTRDQLVLNSCDPDSIKSECAWDERCVPTNEDHSRGWCITETLRDAIINN